MVAKRVKGRIIRFTGHEVPSGTIFLEQGSVGPGLYLILKGRAEVLKYDEGDYVKLADLGPGSLVGEISLLHEQKVTATVRTTATSTLLFLARELFQPLVDSVPELLVHFSQLANERLRATETRLTETRLSKGAAIESSEEIEELTEEDLVLL